MKGPLADRGIDARGGEISTADGPACRARGRRQKLIFKEIGEPGVGTGGQWRLAGGFSFKGKKNRFRG